MSMTLAAAVLAATMRVVARVRGGRAAWFLRRLQRGIVPRVPLPRGAELSRRTRHHRGRAGEFRAGQRYTLSVTLTRPA